MDIVFVNPSYFSAEEYKARFDCFMEWVKKGNMYVYPFEPPLGLASLKAVLDREGFAAELIDQQGMTLELPGLIKKLRDLQPRVVGLTAMTSTFPAVRKLAVEIKKELPEVFLAVGGVHPTVCPEEVLRESAVDVIFRGEAEKTLPLFLKAYPGGRWQEVPGIGYLHEDKVMLNEMPLPIKDLDEIPIPDYTAFPIANYMEYNEHLRNIRGISMLVSRGCPYDCAFCAVKATMGRGWRAKSPKRVVQEIGTLCENFGVEGIWFKDSILNMNRDWFVQLCTLLIDARLPVTWQFNTRVDLLDDESLALARKAGLTQIDLGIESGSPATLERLRKKTTVEQIYKGIQTAKKYAKVSGFFMIGCPGETMDDIEMTFQMAKSLGLDRCSWSIFNPLPGSEFYDQLSGEGRFEKGKVYQEVHFTRVPESFCQVPADELNAKYQEINAYFAGK